MRSKAAAVPAAPPDEPGKALLEASLAAIGADLGAVFILDDDGVSMRGAKGTWDWIRSSFRVRLDLWPTVQHAIRARRVVAITPHSARSFESDWYEPGGIKSSICAPICSDGRAWGVLFADFLSEDREIGVVDLALAKTIARRWARALARSTTGTLSRRGRRARVAEPPRRTSVSSVMSAVPILVDARVPVAVAERIAENHGARHLLAVRDGEVAGVVSRAALEAAKPRSPLGEVMEAAPPVISASAPADEAARTMLETGASCLPVLGAGRRVVGALTRRDLQASGFLPGERGFDVCACCGSAEDLAPRGDGDIVFCRQCLSVSRASGLDSVYVTLGGAG